MQKNELIRNTHFKILMQNDKSLDVGVDVRLTLEFNWKKYTYVAMIIMLLLFPLMCGGALPAVMEFVACVT